MVVAISWWALMVASLPSATPTSPGPVPGIGGCSGAAVAVLPDASGNGYWLVTKTGNVYTFGDAAYYGAPGNTGSPVTSAVRTANGGGYWILTANGTVYDYGNAGAFGEPRRTVRRTAPGHSGLCDLRWSGLLGGRHQTAPSTTSEMLRTTDRCSAPTSTDSSSRPRASKGRDLRPSGRSGARRPFQGSPVTPSSKDSASF